MHSRENIVVFVTGSRQSLDSHHTEILWHGFKYSKNRNITVMNTRHEFKNVSTYLSESFKTVARQRHGEVVSHNQSNLDLK